MEFETHVADIIQRTYNVESFRFPKPASFSHKPGQFMIVTIDVEKGLRKPFTISSSPTEEFLEFTKKFTGSEFSNALSEMERGDWAKIKGPYGDLTFEGEYEKVGMLSGGIGITPLRSMLRYVTDKGLGTDVVLLYACRSVEDIVFREELEEMVRKNRRVRVVFTLDETREGVRYRVGKIDAGMVREEVPDYGERVFYTCGPPGMVEAMSGLLRELGVREECIRKENFAGYEVYGL